MHFYYIFNRPSQEWRKRGGNGPSIFFRNRKEYLRYLKKIFISGPPLPNPTRFLDLLPPMTCQENLGQIQVAIKIQIPEYFCSASEKNCLFISISRQSFWTFSLDPTTNYENMTSIYLLSDRIT